MSLHAGPSIFSDQQLAAQIDKALAAVPLERTGALIAIATSEKATIGIAVRVAKDWQLVTWAEKAWQGPAVVGIAVRGVW